MKKLRKYPNATHYSRNFTRKELDCKCDRHGTGPRKHSRKVRRSLRRLAVNLEKMRKAYGGSVGVLSGYRCPPHNAEVGGALSSQHMQARAADIAVPGRSLRAKLANRAKMLQAAEKVPAFRNGGIGEYPSGAFHVDYRPYRARWTSWGR